MESKLQGANTEMTVWKTVWSAMLQNMSNPDAHRAKKEDESWKDYFLILTGNADTIANTCPSSLQSVDLPFETMLLNLASYVGTLEKKSQEITTSVQKLCKLRGQIQATQKKRRVVAEKQIERMLGPSLTEVAKNLA